MNPVKQVFAPVLSNSSILQNAHLIRMHAPELAAQARPGQFVTVRCGKDVLLRRPFSIHRIEGETLMLLFTSVGSGTDWLAGRSEGDSLDVLGPLGNGFDNRPESSHILMIAGGIGIAPLVFLAERAVAEGRRVKLIHGTATASQLFPQIEGVELLYITEDGSTTENGLVTDLLPSVVPWADQIFACGPMPMYRALAAMETQFIGKPVQVALEQVMGCGVGACRGCAIPTANGMRMACHDGPVFELGEVMWEDI